MLKFAMILSIARMMTDPGTLLCLHKTLMSQTTFDWSDESIIMVFPLSMMSFDVASSLKVCLYGTRACWSCLKMYPFTMGCDSTCVCESFHTACCISLMVKTVGRQVCTMVTMKFSV